MKGEKIIVIVLAVIMILILSFTIYSLYRLYRFGKCYNSEFTLNYCEYYKNY